MTFFNLPLIADPHGIIMTVTSVSVVFSALLILYLCYSLIGKLANTDYSKLIRRRACAKHADQGAPVPGNAPSPEVAAAISMALHEHFHPSCPHDMESYVITIKRTPRRL